MTETSPTTDGFLENPLHENSPLERGDLNKEEEAAPLCRNPGEDGEPEKEIPCAQVNQKRARKIKKQPTSLIIKRNHWLERKLSTKVTPKRASRRVES